MKVAIFGAGSLGTVLGAYIARNNEQIDLINHNKEHIEALKSFGARIVGRVEFNQKVNALTVEEMDDMINHSSEMINELKKAYEKTKESE